MAVKPVTVKCEVSDDDKIITLKVSKKIGKILRHYKRLNVFETPLGVFITTTEVSLDNMSFGDPPSNYDIDIYG